MRLENRTGGYHVEENMIGINAERSSRTAHNTQDGYYAPLLSKGSKLRITLPEERNPKRFEFPQGEWDILHGLIMSYREGDIPVARAYLSKHAESKEKNIIGILKIWAENCGNDNLKKEAERILYGLK